MGHVFGPVRSRRLGLSLGVDLFDRKTCSLDCIYCQLGPTLAPTLGRGRFARADAVVAEVIEKLDRLPEVPDYVTFSGSGEPTLHLDLGRAVQAVRDRTGLPVAVLTNGTLFSDSAVRADLAGADLVVPSLDAATEAVFRAVNRPHPGLTCAGHIDGLRLFAAQHPGPWWLEILLVAGINDQDDELRRLAALVAELGPHRVHLNTVARPPADPSARALTAAALARAADRLGRPDALIESRGGARGSGIGGPDPEELLALLARRPVSAAEAAASLFGDVAQVEAALAALARAGRVKAERLGAETFYRPAGPAPEAQG